MPRFRLRYQATDLELPVGDFVVGRSSSCHLALDDGLVSRRHAIFHVAEQMVTVEDLGSRNGVTVNNEQIEGAVTLKHLDRVVIGAQELLFMRVQGDDGRVRNDRPTLAGMTLDLPIVGNDEVSEEPTVATRSESVLDRIADKALALGRFEEADRMLSRRLRAMLNDAKGGKELSEKQLLAATEYGLKLAQGLKKGEWLDFIFELHDAAEAVIDAETIPRMHDLVRKLRYTGGPAFRTYMANLRGRAANLKPNERFVLQRLEGLERVIAS